MMVKVMMKKIASDGDAGSKKKFAEKVIGIHLIRH